MIYFVNATEKFVVVIFSFASANLLTQESFGLLSYSISVAHIIAVLSAFGTQGVYFREAAGLTQVERDGWKGKIITLYLFTVTLFFVVTSIYNYIWQAPALFLIGVCLCIVLAGYATNLLVTDAIYSGATKTVYQAFALKLFASVMSVFIFYELNQKIELATRLYFELFCALICLIAILRPYPHLITDIFKNPFSVKFNKFQYFGFTMLSQASLIIFMSSDRILLAVLTDLNTVAEYSVLMYGMLPIFITSAIVSVLSKQFFSSYEQKRELSFVIINSYLIRLFPVFLVTFIVYVYIGRYLLSLILPDLYQDVITIIPITCSILMLNYVFLVSTRAHHALRAAKTIFMLNILGLIVNCGFLSITAQHYGFVSGAISTLIAYCVMTFVSTAILAKKGIFHCLNLLIICLYIVTALCPVILMEV
ncbi:MAG: hypothetical protein P8H57_00730 [Emcibacteraceae bacterium]|nr:hypothetical protein [Emcibacteraceae bacterium]